MAEAEPTSPELTERAIASRLEDLHTAGPGIVVSYDSAKRTAEVQPAWNRPTLNTDGGIAEEVLPPLTNVPVMWPRSATFSITSTLVKGDTVLLVFNGRSPTGWRTTGEVSTPQDLRIHGLGYPVAIPGYCPDTIDNSDTDDSIGRPGGLRIHFTESVVEVGNGTDFAGDATKMATELEKIAAAFTSFIPGSGGASFGAPYTTAGAVACSNLKVDP